ncbi:Intermediate filament protein, partial [Lobosporangium transversale]
MLPEPVPIATPGKNSRWFAQSLHLTSFKFAISIGLVLILLLTKTFGNSVLSRIATFILAAPIVFILSLLTLAASNIAFSILYARRQRQNAATALSVTSNVQQNKSNHTNRTMPGSESRLMFHYLRPAKFTRPVVWSNIEKQRRQEQVAEYREPIAKTMPDFSDAVDSLIELIIRDYVASWMRSITPEVMLQQRIEKLLRIALIRLKTRLMGLDLTQLLVTRLVPKVTAHVNDFRKAEMALRGNSLERSLTESDELDIMVASKFRNGKLHRALSTSISTQATEEAYLRNVVQAILPTLLPPSEVQSEILRHLLRELLVCVVLRPVMDLLSDPDYWNQNVDLYIGKAIREQNMVKKLREALKQHTDNMDYDSKSLSSNSVDPYGAGADLYSFEDFLKMIKRCDSLLDVKRIRNTIITQIRKKKSLIAGCDKDEIVNGSKVEDIIVYINRLDIAKKRAEKRIEALGGPAYSKRRSRENADTKNPPSLIDLHTILNNPSGLSYFMEFQDRKDNMNELQFWLLIDTLNIKISTEQKGEAGSTAFVGVGEPTSRNRSALNTPSSTHSRKQDQKSLGALTPSSTSTDSTPKPPSNIAGSIRSNRKASISTIVEGTDTLRDDVRMIYDTYFSESAPRPVVIDHSLVDVLREFSMTENSNIHSSIDKSSSSSELEIKKNEDARVSNVRQKLLEAQQQVFDQMQQRDYPEFVKSDLYFKFLTSYQNSLAEASHKGKEARGHRRTSSYQRPPNAGPTLFSAIGLSSSDKRKETPENTKRSSAGSFLDIFGLGRDKEREQDREREKDREQQQQDSLKRTETSISNFRPSFLLSAHTRSKSGSPVSIDSTHSAQQPSGSKPKQSLDIPSSSLEAKRPPLARTRSLSSISNPELPVSGSHGTQVIIPSSYRKSPSTVGHGRENSLDLTDTERYERPSSAGESTPVLRSSLLMELQGQEEDEEDLEVDNHEGLSIPGISKKRPDKEDVIVAVEAALTSIMENQDAQQEDSSVSDLKRKGGVGSELLDPIDPRADALKDWGKSEKPSRQGFKEKTLEDGKTTRVKSRDPSDSGYSPLSSVFEFKMSKGSSSSTIDKQGLSPAVDNVSPSDDDIDDKRMEEMKPTIGRNLEDPTRDLHSLQRSVKRDYTSPNEAESTGDLVKENVHLAAPGDLLLSTKIKKLEQDIETVLKQEAIVETLIQKAERQGRENELRILKKSKSDIRREIRSMEYQKTLYEVQEQENMIMP